MTNCKQCCQYISDFNFSGIMHKDTAIEAVTYYHVECLKIAHQNGAEIDDYMFTYTMSGSKEPFNFDCVKYLIENHYSYHDETLFHMLDAFDYYLDLDDLWWRNFLFNKDIPPFYEDLRSRIKYKKSKL